MCQLAGHVYGESSQLSWDDCMTAFSALSKFCMDGWDNIFTGADSKLRPANERRRYKVTPLLIVWVQT